MIVFLLVMIVGMVFGIKNFVFGCDVLFFFFFDSLEILVGVMVLFVMFIFGGMFVEGFDDFKFGFRIIIGMIVVSLLGFFFIWNWGYDIGE